MDFQVGGVNYRTSKMDAMTQFHLARKLMPVMAKLSSLNGLMKPENEGGGLNAVIPIAEAIADLPEEVCNQIISISMRHVTRESGVGYSPVWSAQAKQPMFDDIDMVKMMQIVMAVVQDSLSSFIPALPPTLTVSVPKG